MTNEQIIFNASVQLMNQEEAEALVRMYERQDRYERDVEGYKNPLPKYEIR